MERARQFNLAINAEVTIYHGGRDAGNFIESRTQHLLTAPQSVCHITEFISRPVCNPMAHITIAHILQYHFGFIQRNQNGANQPDCEQDYQNHCCYQQDNHDNNGASNRLLLRFLYLQDTSINCLIERSYVITKFIQCLRCIR